MNTYNIAVVDGDGIGPEVIGRGSTCWPRPAGSWADSSSTSCGPGRRGDVSRTGRGPARRDAGGLPRRPTRSCSAPAACPASATPTAPRSSPRSRCGSCSTCTRASAPRGGSTASPAPLAGEPAIDFVVVRESTEGIFASLGGGIVLGDQVATDTQVITRRGTERVVRAAFELARRRGRARAARDLRRQGEHPPLVRLLPQGLRRGRRPSSPTSRPTTCTSTPRRWSWCAGPSGSTCW